MPINSFLYPAPTNSNTYEVANSLRFDDGSSDYLIRTPASAGNQSTWTYSVWIKRGNLGSGTAPAYTLLSGDTASNYGDMFRLREDKFNFRNFSNSTNYYFSDRLYRDTSAWYHFVIKYDGANSVVQLYVNGELEGSVSIGLNENSTINDNEPQMIGAWQSSSPNNYFDGYMAEAVMVDGQALDPTSFGEFDADSGIWKPKNVSGLTFGTNGFYLDFENSGSLGADVSGNGNNFTVNNLTAIDQSTDTCTNNFCTANPLDNYYFNGSYTNGNVTVTSDTSNYSWNTGTFGVSKGKWYWEIKVITETTGSQSILGISSTQSTGTTQELGDKANDYGYYAGNGNYRNNNTNTAYGSAYAVGDIINFALDLDNNKLYFGKNGTWQNSGVPTSGATGTGAISITASSSTPLGAYFPSWCFFDSSNYAVWDLNFGSPSFAISSGNTDGNGYGNFEYAVPSGYYSLNSKNLAEYG